MNNKEKNNTDNMIQPTETTKLIKPNQKIGREKPQLEPMEEEIPDNQYKSKSILSTETETSTLSRHSLRYTMFDRGPFIVSIRMNNATII